MHEESKLLKKYGLRTFVAGKGYHLKLSDVGESGFYKECARMKSDFGIKTPYTYYGVLKHEDNVHICDIENDEKASSNAADIIYRVEDCDGLVADNSDISLIIKFADCTPIIFFDPLSKVQAVVHSGWRGTLKKISQKAVRTMQTEFGSEIKNIICFIGPSIDVDNYEVGQEVYEAFSDFANRDEFFRKSEIEGKYQLDMSLANRLLIDEIGIPSEHIEVSTRSTYNDTNLYSARRDKGNYELNAIITEIIN